MATRKHLTKPVVIVGVAVGITAATAGFAGAAELASSPKTVTVCANTKGQVVSLTSRGKCPAKSTSVTLNTKGVQGPAGPAGAPGANGNNGLNGTNGTNGTNGKDGADGPGALGTALDNSSNQLESTGVQQITGTGLYFNVQCQPGVSASFVIKNPANARIRAHGTVFLDNAASTGSTWAAGNETGSATTGTSFVTYDTSTDAKGFKGPVVTVNDSSGTVNISADLLLQQDASATDTTLLPTATFAATVTPTSCYASAQVTPSE